MGSGSGEITGIMSQAGEVVTGVFDWVSTAIDAITSNPLILMCCLLPFVGMGVALLRKLLKVKARG